MLDIQNIKEFTWQLMIENKIISVLLITAACLIVSSLFIDKKVTLKKRKNQIKHNKIAEFLYRYIDKIKFISDKRDKFAIQLALITKASTRSNKIYANNIISTFFFLTILAFLLSIIFIQNLILKISIPMLLFIMIPFIFDYFISKKRKKAIEDFAKIISSFTSQFAYSFNVLYSLQESIKDIPDTYKYEFSRLITVMNSEEDYIQALDEFASRINYNLCYIFVEILKSAFYNNAGTVESLIELENLTSLHKKSQLSSDNELNEKKSNIFLWFIFAILFLIVDIVFIGDFTINFYLHTFLGQVIMLISIIVSIIVLIITYVVDKI